MFLSSSSGVLNEGKRKKVTSLGKAVMEESSSISFEIIRWPVQMSFVQLGKECKNARMTCELWLGSC